MRNKTFLILPLLLLCIALTACGGSGDNLKRLGGTWAVDVEASAKLAGEQMSDLELELMKGILGAITIQFDPDKKEISMSIGGLSESKKFEVVSDSKNTIVIKDTDVTTIVFKNDDQIEMTGDDGKTLVLKRLK